MVAEICQSFILDNGAFSFWKRGDKRTDIRQWLDYARFVMNWATHPGCDFFLIPDVIDGTAIRCSLCVYRRRRRNAYCVFRSANWHKLDSALSTNVLN